MTTRRRSLGTVVAWVGTGQQRARLVDALKNDAAVTLVSSSNDLLDILRTALTINLAVIPSADGDGGSTERLVRRIARERPRTAIVVWFPARPYQPNDLRGFTIAGAHQFLMSGRQDDGVFLRAVLAKAVQTNAAEQVMRELAPTLPTAVHPLVEAILERPDEITSIRQLADALGIHRRTIFNRCERAAELSPTELLGWARLSLVAYYLENTGCTVETIAMDLAYPSSTTLRNTLKRYTGLRAQELRECGPMRAVVGALGRRLTA